MFYRTYHQHFLFNFNNFPQFSPLSQFQEMESAKEDCRTGFEVKTEAEEEFAGGGGGGDDFSVDELLDFSNGYSETEEQLTEERRGAEEGKLETTSLLQERSGAVSLSKREEFGSLDDGELCFEAEGLESLEWLSHFMDDSISDYSLAGKLPDAAAAAAKKDPCFTTPVQTKARTKRARAGPPVWHVLSSTEQSSSPPSSTSSTASFPQSDSPPESAPAKKKRKHAAAADGGGAAQPRKCSHCGVTKTPQWRAGPLGAKTLCNACGVRYKSGRLLPEYRPACSPTFSTEIHSNNHRKVLEMRQKKGTEVAAAGSELLST